MKVWTATAQLVCTPSSQFLYTQNCCQPLSTRVPFSVPLLGFKGCCQLMRLGQSYYEGLSLKMHKHVSDHFCSANGLIKQWDFLFSSDLQARNALFQRKLMNLANHVLLHHKGQGKRKSLLEKWGASQQKARMYSVSVLFFNEGRRANIGQAHLCLPLYATASLISRLKKYSMRFVLDQTVLHIFLEQQANIW